MSRTTLDFLQHVTADETIPEPASGNTLQWRHIDNGLSSYFDGTVVYVSNGDFYRPESAPTTIIDLIRSSLGRAPSYLDIAAGPNGKAARDVLQEFSPTRALFTTLHDLRDINQEAPAGLDFLSGDLCSIVAWQGIEKWQVQHAPDGIGVTTFRPVSFLQDLPLAYYKGAFNWLLDHTAPGGLLVVQTPNKVIDAINIARCSIKNILDSRGDSTERYMCPQVIDGKQKVLYTVVQKNLAQ